MSKDNTVYISRDFELMMISAMRYAIGRQTYMPSVTIDYIRMLIHKLSANTLYVMERDIREEVERYERMGHELYMKREWVGLMNDINEAYKFKKAVEDAFKEET